MASKGTIKLGPWGGAGGPPWDYNPGSNTAIIEIVISYGNMVNSLSFKSVNRDTKEVISSDTYGVSRSVIKTISLDGDKEYLTSMTVTRTGTGAATGTMTATATVTGTATALVIGTVTGTVTGTGTGTGTETETGTGTGTGTETKTRPDYIGSITFHTNRNKYGPFGNTNGLVYELSLENAQIVGFFGRADAAINALGIYMIPYAK